VTGSFSTAAKFNADVRNLGIVGILIVSAIVVYWFVGTTDRVIYLGPDHGQVPVDNQVPLKTEPPGSYLIERNENYAAMKAGCRYDLNYAPAFRRNRGGNSTLGQTKHIRSVTLVSCP
jgi:hypothetical protein